MRQIGFVHTLIGCKERVINFVAFLSKISLPESNEDILDKLKLRVILQKNVPGIFKFQGKQSRDFIILCRLCSCSGSFCCQGCCWDNRWNSSGVCGLDGGDILLTSWH